MLALLTILQPEVELPAGLGDPIATAATWAADGKAISAIDFRLLIETFEWLYRYHKVRDVKRADAFAEAGLPLFDHLAHLPDLSARQRSEIGHHRGKALQWLRRHGEARAVFEEVLKSDHPLDATRLQLLRSYKAERAFAEASALILPVIEAAERGEAVSPSVLLAAIQDLPWQDAPTRKSVIEPRYPFIETLIISHARAGYDQAYKTLAAAARYWSKEAPEILARVLSEIPTPDVNRLTDDEVRSSFADLLLEYARTQGAEGAATRETALSFFEAVQSPSAFHRQRTAELLIDMDEPDRAMAILERLAENCWVQRLLAKARLTQGEFATALTLIDAALADPKGESKYYEFLELRHDIRRAQGDSDAIADLEKAVQLAPEGPEADRIRATLDMRLRPSPTTMQ
jgi:tetratricopeptide (TPR) repeat protein